MRNGTHGDGLEGFEIKRAVIEVWFHPEKGCFLDIFQDLLSLGYVYNHTGEKRVDGEKKEVFT